MRLKILFLSLLVSVGVLNAQDTIKTLVISEARLDAAQNAYVEFTNVGTTTLNLNDFEFGTIGPWTQPYEADPDYWVMIGPLLPDSMLAPGESVVFAMVYDFGPEMWLQDPDNYDEEITKPEMWELADVQFHFPEPKGFYPKDSVSPWYHAMEVWNGRDCWYLRHHLDNGDSAVIDQVNGIFDEDDGTSADMAHDVAGVTDATNNSTLVRKFSVKKGNLNFDQARGLDLADSEWMPIPRLFGGWEPNRAVFWTVGNHGDYNLEPGVLNSSTAVIDWDAETITLPWGVRNNDSVMYQFDRTPGIAWHYHLAETTEDSAHISARTGDILTVYGCGNDLDMIDFHIIVEDPTASENRVLPLAALNDEGYYGEWVSAVYEITDGVPGMDTIREVPFATRIDTLFKYLEKAPNASWEVITVDGIERADLKDGDILKVTAEDGSEKEYFISVEEYRPSHNAYLSSITWPDIPNALRGLYGFVEDTIPNFVRSKYEYSLVLPPNTNDIPGLIGKTENLNAKLDVDRAKSLFGPADSRTVTFTSTAEDDTTVLTYKVTLQREKDESDVQPWAGEPFLSQLIFWEQWNNGFLEICNPGNQELDLSNYMIFFQWSNDPAEAITWASAANEDDWTNRYMKYIPGYKWGNHDEWMVNPGIAIQDLNVDPIVAPGDVFVLADIRSTGNSGYPWWASEQADIDFSHNPWGEDVGETCARQWMGANFFLYKILNDSVKQGLKPANDPDDFELIETFGMGESVDWVIGGVKAEMINSWVRKPQYFQGKTGFKESFGTDQESSEWIMTDRAYYQALNVGWPAEILLVADGLGTHYMYDVTIYRSTITSLTYIVSEGYSMEEQIRGVTTGTTVSQFLENINKADTGQDLTFKSGNTVLGADDALTNGDSLIVVSADETNMSAYILEVTDEGLSDDAVLTSTTYTVDIDGSTGTISGFAPGTSIKSVKNNVQVPAGAHMNIIDENDAYVSLTRLNYDTAYVDVPATNNVYFEVIAEDMVTTIVYQLKPDVVATDAYINSWVYEVDQDADLIQLIPMGTTVNAFFLNLVPAEGATIQLVDKYGNDRSMGNVYKDDKLIVTAQDGETQRIYYLSMLEEQGYLAYVLSDEYLVNQVNLNISEVPENTSVSDFLANLSPAPGATLEVLHEDDTPNTDVLVNNDKLKVTSGNEENVVFYSIDFTIGVDDMNGDLVKMYPNPTTGQVHLSGLKEGTRVQVYNITGVCLRDIPVRTAEESFSLEGQTSGMYFVVITDKNNVVGRYKLILK